MKIRLYAVKKTNSNRVNFNNIKTKVQTKGIKSTH